MCSIVLQVFFTNFFLALTVVVSGQRLHFCNPVVTNSRREGKGKGQRERHIQLNPEFKKIARRGKKGFFNEECLIIEENNKRGKTRDLFRKIGNIKGGFLPKIGTIKDKNGRDLVDPEENKKR